jgi:hypothetical protein
MSDNYEADSDSGDKLAALRAKQLVISRANEIHKAVQPDPAWLRHQTVGVCMCPACPPRVARKPRLTQRRIAVKKYNREPQSVLDVVGSPPTPRKMFPTPSQKPLEAPPGTRVSSFLLRCR